MLHLYFLLLCLQCLALIRNTHGHGYLLDPPARSSAWLFDPDFKACCQHFNHYEMSCGGSYRQWTLNGEEDYRDDSSVLHCHSLQEANVPFVGNPTISHHTHSVWAMRCI